MSRYAIVGINCDGYCHPTSYVTGIRHWLAVALDGGALRIGVAEQSQADHAECGKLAAQSVTGALLPIPDNATAQQIADAITAAGIGCVATVSGAGIATIVPNATAAPCYDCWRAQMETVNLVLCHNAGMGTVVIEKEDTMTPAQLDALVAAIVYLAGYVDDLGRVPESDAVVEGWAQSIAAAINAGSRASVEQACGNLVTAVGAGATGARIARLEAAVAALQAKLAATPSAGGASVAEVEADIAKKLTS